MSTATVDVLSAQERAIVEKTIIQDGAYAFIAAKGAPDAVTVADEDKKIIDDVRYPYWKARTLPPTSSRRCLLKPDSADAPQGAITMCILAIFLGAILSWFAAAAILRHFRASAGGPAVSYSAGGH